MERRVVKTLTGIDGSIRRGICKSFRLTRQWMEVLNVMIKLSNIGRKLGEGRRNRKR